MANASFPHVNDSGSDPEFPVTFCNVKASHLLPQTE